MTPTVEEGPFVTVADPAPAPGLWTLLQVIHTNSTGGQENIWSWCSSHVVGGTELNPAGITFGSSTAGNGTPHHCEC